MKLKKISAQLFGLSCSVGLLFATGAAGMTVSATTVSDVIAHAYAVGLPESYIQQCINQYSGGDYTSEQCDAAIAALDNWAAQRDSAIDDAIDEGTSDSSASDSSTSDSTASSTTASDSSSTTTTEVTESDFINMTLEEKVEYINSLSEEDYTTFMDNMSNEAKNSFLKQLDTDSQLEVIANLIDVGDSFGLNYSVDSVSDGAIVLSARDDEGNLIDVTTFGDTVEQTGISYTKPIIIGLGAIALATIGFSGIFWCSFKKKKQ